VIATMAAAAALTALPTPPLPLHALIVADEIPAMQVLAERMKELEGVEARIVMQGEMPTDLKPFGAVLVYIHGRLEDAAEQALLRYAEGGGRLVLLHHSISSGKRRNRDWFGKLGVELREGDVELGGYKWIEGVTLTVVNLAPRHFITTHGVTYPEQAPFPDARGRGVQGPAVSLHDSEVYINHRLTGRRTTLLGFSYTDKATGKTWTQPTAGWTMRLGRGRIVYLMPGHTIDEFRNPTYARLVTNAVVWQP
jgi:hypothetical protein